MPTQSRLSRREASIECSKTGSSLVTIYNQAQQKAVSDFIVTKLPPRTLVYDVDVWTAMLYYIGVSWPGVRIAFVVSSYFVNMGFTSTFGVGNSGFRQYG